MAAEVPVSPPPMMAMRFMGVVGFLAKTQNIDQEECQVLQKLKTESPGKKNSFNKVVQLKWPGVSCLVVVVLFCWFVVVMV